MDPNFLPITNMGESPFNQAINDFGERQRESSTPLLHLDFHGKKNRKTNLNLDVGSTALKSDWQDGDQLCNDCLKKLDSLFRKMFSTHEKYQNGHRFWFNLDPILEGYWSSHTGVFTMVMQSTSLGIPGIQFEMPYTMRKVLIENERLLDQLALLIQELQSTVITEQWKNKNASKQLKTSTELGNKVISSNTIDIDAIMEGCRSQEKENNKQERMI